MDEYLGIIKIFAGTFVPRGWALCDGSSIAISQNTALYSLLGITYGGDGRTTFALPNLMGRVAVGTGRGGGLSEITAGEKGGSESVTLLAAQMPRHSHSSIVNSTIATQSDATNGASIATPGVVDGRGATPTLGFNMATPNVALNAGSVGLSGDGQAHTNMQPYLGVMYIICVQGLFPQRN